eukprot:5989726-Pyramimonas_sp.AAC.1
MQTGEPDLRHHNGLDPQVYSSNRSKADSGNTDWLRRRTCLSSTPIDQTAKTTMHGHIPWTWTPHRLRH